ncbi:hypothetical protein BGZ70_005613 [Mortierella alpina]|uniref:Uncharacterized protein n=1 Tax=Mortierella alpina TaxID=64518 RepID=A0A9P6JF97_MORAP|nr:hypothetical protein BGZ70_005613 [Mortierella alpina]
MWAPSFTTVRNVQHLTLGIACSSIILFISSFTLGQGGALQYPMIVSTVAVAVYVYYKNSMAIEERQITLAQSEDKLVLYLGGGFNGAIAICLIMDGVLVELYSRHRRNKRATSSRNISVDSLGNTGAADAPQAPLPVHLYQPRLALTPNERTSAHFGTAAPTGSDTETAQQDSDTMELEELPKYQRRRPAQHATIVDMANLDNVDATLRSAISVSSMEVTSNDGSGLGQGQDVRLEFGDDLSTVEAPEYSPSLVAPSAETVAPLIPPAPSSGSNSTQLATSAHSGSPVMLDMPLSGAPAGPSMAPVTDTPSITVTSAPPVYSP